MGKDVLYAGGFASPWTKDAEEIKASQKDGGWHPATVDFAATASASGGGTAVSSLTDILNYLRSKPEGSVEDLTIIGHAASGVFALGGNIIAPKGAQRGNVQFTAGNYINDQVLSANASQIGAVKTKFAKDAKIVLVGCDAGLGTTLLNQFSTAFGVCVLGFSDKVWTGFMVASNSQITSRGHVYVDSSGLMGSGMAPSVQFWSKDVGKLAPDSKSANCP